VAGGGALQGLAQEAVLQPTHPDRTIADGITNVASSAIVGGLLGSAAGLVPAAKNAGRISHSPRPTRDITAPLIDQLVGSGEQDFRNGKAKSFGGLSVCPRTY
jgi:hypothetical protein